MTHIIVGDSLEVLRGMESESVNCIVTSPPYWGLRDYGNPGQIGLEKTPQEFVAKMTEVFSECRRVLAKDGTCWVNMGDSYASAWACDRRNVVGNGSLENGKRDHRPNRLTGRLKEKDLCGIPWRLALSLQDDGWYLRSDIIWAKPNPMPESVTDRPTKSHEYIFLLTKSAKYWYDADAIRSDLKQVSIDRLNQPNYENQKGSTRANGGTGYVRGAIVQGKSNGNMKAVASKNERSGQETKVNLNANWDKAEAEGNLKGANARTVWEIPTKPYVEAHFATFPEELPRRCILAGCPEGGTVLDPFAGSGTTSAVAIQLGRNGFGIELNPDYAELARKRIAGVTPSMFGEVA